MQFRLRGNRYTNEHLSLQTRIKHTDVCVAVPLGSSYSIIDHDAMVRSF